MQLFLKMVHIQETRIEAGNTHDTFYWQGLNFEHGSNEIIKQIL